MKRVASFLGAVSFLALGASSAFAGPLEDMISPVSDPVNFEDPRATTELRPIFVYHEIDDEFATGGGNVMIFALQARYAVNDRLSIIATKDGFVEFKPDGLLNDGKGFANIAGGAKYAFYKDDAGYIASGGLRYEIPIGEEDVLQGQGDGSFNPFVSGAAAFGPINVMSYTGFRFAVSDKDSSFYDLDLHADTKLGMFYPLVEMSLVHVLSAGERLPIADEGQDYFNLGASESDGKTMLTGAAGARLRLTDNVDFGVAYQFPMNRGNGTRITDWRITSDLVFRF